MAKKKTRSRPRYRTVTQRGGHRIKAVLSHLFLLFGLACLALAVLLWVLHALGYS